MTINTLEKLIHRKIPLTKKMGLRVIKSSAQKVIFSLPHSENINHVGTVFGGSIAAAQAVCCWGFLLNFFAAEELEALKPVVVLKEGTNRYFAPLKSRFLVECKAPPVSVLKRFKSALVKKGRAPLVLKATAHPTVRASKRGGKSAVSAKKAHVEFVGEYVVYRK